MILKLVTWPSLSISFSIQLLATYKRQLSCRSQTFRPRFDLKRFNLIKGQSKVILRSNHLKGAEWKFPIKLDVVEPKPDDVIRLPGCEIGQTSVVTFDLFSSDQNSIPFTAGLVTGSSPEFTVSTWQYDVISMTHILWRNSLWRNRNYVTFVVGTKRRRTFACRWGRYQIHNNLQSRNLRKEMQGKIHDQHTAANGMSHKHHKTLRNDGII